MEITFKARPKRIGKVILLHLPEEISKNLPSRGMLMVEGIINNLEFTAPLEPDGKGSHWMELDDALLRKLDLSSREELHITIEPMKKWEDPKIPEDLKESLVEKQLLEAWDSLTPKAKWEWIRWIRSTKNQSTRAKRIGVACSKLEAGDRRPCCFNSSSCTVPELSKSGILLDIEESE